MEPESAKWGRPINSLGAPPEGWEAPPTLHRRLYEGHSLRHIPLLTDGPGNQIEQRVQDVPALRVERRPSVTV